MSNFEDSSDILTEKLEASIQQKPTKPEDVDSEVPSDLKQKEAVTEAAPTDITKDEALANEKETPKGIRHRTGAATMKEKAESNLVDDVTQEEKDENEGTGARVGMTFDGKTFSVPTTKNPLAFHPMREWNFFDWAKNSSLLNLLWLLLPLPKWVYLFAKCGKI